VVSALACRIFFFLEKVARGKDEVEHHGCTISKCELDSSGSGYGPLAGFCEPSGSLK